MSSWLNGTEDSIFHNIEYCYRSGKAEAVSKWPTEKLRVASCEDGQRIKVAMRALFEVSSRCGSAQVVVSGTDVVDSVSRGCSDKITLPGHLRHVL